MAYSTHHRYCQRSLFNVLNNLLDWESVKMLDLFGGTGNHCYEFISRGCMDATYVDKFMGCIRFVHELRQKLNLEKELTIVKSDVFKYINACNQQYDYIFAVRHIRYPIYLKFQILYLKKNYSNQTAYLLWKPIRNTIFMLIPILFS
jgi:16S rRNA G966 N2-methylase RsmD